MSSATSYYSILQLLQGIAVGGFALLCLQCFSGIVAAAANEDDDATKVYALYFPQFYADPLNNRLWGDGFTEWNNLRAAPKINKYGATIAVPTELGYYNLLDRNVRQRQRELAKQYGIDGFIYHHYWFHHPGEGASLAGVINAMLEDGEPQLPFAFNWAKDSWVTTWHSKYSSDYQPQLNKTLVEQLLPPPDDPRVEAHYRFLRQFFRHERYIKVNGAPLFSVYGGDPLDGSLIALLQQMKLLAMADGFPSPGLHIPMLQRMSKHSLYTAQFPPPRVDYDAVESGVYDAVLYYPFNDSPQRQMKMPPLCRATIHTSNPLPAYVAVNSVFDNTPRRSVEGAHIFNRTFGGTQVDPPTSFHLDVVTALVYDRCCIQSGMVRQRGGKYMLVNAWNEWGEGMVLEPSDKYGRKLLEAVKTAKETAAKIDCDWQKYDDYMLQHFDSLLYTDEEILAAGVAHYGRKYHSLHRKPPAKSIAEYYPQPSAQDLAEMVDDDKLQYNDDFDEKWRGKVIPTHLAKMRERSMAALSERESMQKKDDQSTPGPKNSHKRDVLHKARKESHHNRLRRQNKQQQQQK